MSDNGHPIPNDELISAFYDGELSEADRARAEQLLLDDPNARRLLDDLRRMSKQVQSFPRKELGESFSAEVLRRAERELLVPSQIQKRIEKTESDSSGRPWLHWPSGRRPWVWAAAAVAAAIVVMIAAQDGKHEHLNVVMAPTPAEPTTTVSFKTDGVMNERLPSLELRAKWAPETEQRLGELAADVAGGGGLANGEQGGESVARQLGEMGYDAPVSQHLAFQAAAVDRLNYAMPVSSGVVVVEVDIDAAQLKSDPFTHVLLDNSIQPATIPQTQMANLQNNLAQSQALNEFNARLAGAAPPTNGVDLVYVVAPPAQLAGAVSQLQTQSTQFRRVIVRDAEEGRNTSSLNLGRAGNDAYFKENAAVAAKADARASDNVKSKTSALVDDLKGVNKDAAKPIAPAQTASAPSTPPVAKAAEAASSATENMAEKKAAAGKNIEQLDDLAKLAVQTQNPASSAGWFGRLTLPPASSFNYGYYNSLGVDQRVQNRTRDAQNDRYSAGQPPASLAPLAPGGAVVGAANQPARGMQLTEDEMSRRKGLQQPEAQPLQAGSKLQEGQKQTYFAGDKSADKPAELRELQRDLSKREEGGKSNTQSKSGGEAAGLEGTTQNAVQPLQRALFVFHVHDAAQSPALVPAVTVPTGGAPAGGASAGAPAPVAGPASSAKPAEPKAPVAKSPEAKSTDAKPSSPSPSPSPKQP